MNVSQDRSGLRISVYQDFESVGHLKEPWNDLLAQSKHPNIFLTWEWITTWWKWFGTEKQLRLVVATDGSEVIGILPAWFDRISIVPGLRVKGVGLLGDGGPVCPEYLGPIVHEQDAYSITSQMLESLLLACKGWQVIRLADVLLDSADVSLAVKGISNKFFTNISEGEICFYQPLPSNYKTYLDELSRKRRKTIRQTLNRAKREHSVKFECITKPESVPTAFSTLYDIYNSSTRGRNNTGGWGRDDYRGFHQEVARAFAKRDWLRLYILRFDERPVAFLYCYQYGNCLWAYQTGFDQAYSKIGPGSIIFQLTIEAAIEEGLSEFDYLRGDESYKLHLARFQRHQSSVMLFRNRGLCQLAFLARHNLSRLAHTLRK